MDRPKPRTTRTTTLRSLDSLTLGDLRGFLATCADEGWSDDAQVGISRTVGDRPGERTTYQLSVTETR
ncbi:hypothetical protein KNU62_gp80 [Gordonia phage Bakery]|uniref:Uncharacterized protein n=1 Tax=Gordonia phage Bakery TaxID=2591205 RepID=A0A514DGY0_9CAUD|nr:hypothetical protein KNU62_gp80 [Gordonia phage Bakery]QDH92865.1 hypothetical protein SEA_BAKERY_80 [Gordonia phage Bakery]